MQEKSVIISFILISLITIILFLHNILYSPPGYNGPAIFADVSFKPVSGFTVTLKLSSGKYSQHEFVIPPNSTGILAVNYYSELNNLCSPIDLKSGGILYPGVVYPWKIDIVNIKIDLNADIRVVIKPVKTVVTSIHNVTIYYLIDTHNVEPNTYGVYVIPFPSTSFRAILVVGSVPYYGFFPWDWNVYA